MDLPEKVRNKLRTLPDAPGCYMMRDHRGRIIYVGKAASLRKRVQSYFRDAALRSGSPKLRSLVRSVRDLDILVLRNEAEAILTEGRLIKDYRPRFNVSFTDDKRFLLLRADARDPFPMLKACRLRREDGALYFGPFVSSAATRTTLDFVEKKFGLRKCSPPLPDEQTHRHCMNDIVRFCSAPCVGKVTKEQYHERFAEACAFLRGQRPALLQEIRDAMNEAAAKTDFEKAGALRDTLFALQATVRQNARIASTPALKEQEGLAAIEQLKTELALPSLPRRIEAYDISNISGTHAVASMVCAINGLPQRSRYRRFRIRTVEGSNDPAMMAEVIRRRFERLQREGGEWPDLIVVDGGATQLQAARQVMQSLGVSTVPTAGLAKQFEDLYVSEKGPPLSLPRDSQALKALQRLRDEAHRFALAYHQRLRSRLMRESALDDIPGIGKTRKKQLLEHFGSVYRLSRASLDDIAAAPHVGEEIARLVYQTLHPDGDTTPSEEG